MRWLYRICLPVIVLGFACTPDDSTGLALEVCDNGLDDDANGVIDCDDPRCSSAQNCLASSNCGDGQRTGLEFCDGDDLGGASCETQGFLAGVGTLGCRSDCAGFDTGGCVREDLCGNGLREGGEACDGDDLAGATCLAAGFAEGDVSCDDQCQVVTTGCSGVNPCGNGVLDNGEACDGLELNGATCESIGFQGEGLACNATCDGFDSSACEINLCGNGRIDAGELCDGAPENRTCIDQGFAGGTLRCSDSCDAFVTTDCTLCGNDRIDDGEVCDGAELAGSTCSRLGFFAGELRCATSCDGFDTASCNNCGNGVLDDGEVCEGDPERADPPMTCADLGYADGRLGCSSDCGAFVTQNCIGFPECGNGVLDGVPGDRQYQEFCEPGIPVFVDPFFLGLFELEDGCAEYGSMGDVVCNPDCTLDFGGCTTLPEDVVFCDILTSFVGGCHACDRIDGVADPNCQPIENPTCGDNVADGTIGSSSASSPYDWCDGDDLRGNTCESLGFASGTLRCRDDCNFDTGGCVATRCGDGVIQFREVCDGDRPCTEVDPDRFVSGTTQCAIHCLEEDLSNCTE